MIITKRKLIKKPKYCKDKIEPPYKLCWTYALNIKNFEKEHCNKCPFYNRYKANPIDLLVRLPLNLWWAFNIGRDKQEPEKALLPALIVINSKSFPEFEHISGYMFALGWWDWSIKFGIFHKRSA